MVQKVIDRENHLTILKGMIFSKNGKTRILEIFNQDKTGTNDYSILKITCDTLSEVESELDGQLSDGIFENFRVGRIDEVQ